MIPHSTFHIPNFSYRRLSAFIGGLLVLCLAVSIEAQINSGGQENINGKAGTFIIRNAKIVTVSGETMENGTIIIRDGKIAQIGVGINAPSDEVIEGKGLTVYPGMIDASTKMGLNEIPLGAPGTVDDTEVGDMNPNASAIISIYPFSTHINVTRVGGVTSVVTIPAGGVISGQAAFINLAGATPNEMAVVPQAGLAVNFPRISTFGGFGGGFGGQPIEFGEAVKLRDKRLEDLRKILKDALEYGRIQDAYKQDKTLPRPKTDLKMESLVQYVRGEKPVLMHVDRENDIKKAVAFADELKLKIIIVGGNDAWKTADLLKTKNIPVILTGVWSNQARDDDYYDVLYENAAKLQKAGVKFCISTNDEGPNVRDLPYQAGMAAAFGLPKDEALKAVTLYPAQIFGVGDKLGSLETGKIANLVVTDGDILEARTKILHLFINGRKMPLTSRHTELYEQFKNRKLGN